MLGGSLHTIVETPDFIRDARRCLSDAERVAFINHVAASPSAGDVIQGTGGARKVRWATRGRGKSGSVRVITFYSGPPVPVFPLNVFGKSERVNLSKSERNALRRILAAIVENYRNGAPP